MQPKILVIRGGALGDFVLTFPVLAALRRAFPGHRLDLLANARFAPLAAAGGLANVVYHLDSPQLAGFFARDGSQPPEIARYFSEFEWIVSYLYDPEKIFEANVRGCSTAHFVPGPHRPEDSSPLHAAQLLLKPLEALGISGADSAPHLSLPKAPAPTRLPAPGMWLAAHPGSGSERKNWPEPKWLELVKLIIEKSPWNLLLIGGEADGERAMRLAAQFPLDRARIAQGLPLVELAQSLPECAAFIGHDSGITHLAAALGLPGLVLWGETPESVWRPPRDKMNLLRAGAKLKHLEAATVFEELQRILEPLGGRVSRRAQTLS